MGSRRPLDIGEEVKPKRVKVSAEYEYNPATGRWEPAAKSKVEAPAPARASQPSVSSGPSRAAQASSCPGPSSDGHWARPCKNFALGLCNFGARCRFIHDAADVRQEAHGARQEAYGAWQEAPGSSAAEPPMLRKSSIIGQCEAEARSDSVRGLCDFMQALAVRLALRFESQPSDILSSMAEAGLPAAKDQRSTVKAIMRLCHPDKCKHPEAKRAMQILSPLL